MKVKITFFHTTVAILTDLEFAKKRFQDKTHQDERDFEMRMTYQLSPEEKSAKADYTLLNNGDFSALQKEVNTLYQHLTRKE